MLDAGEKQSLHVYVDFVLYLHHDSTVLVSKEKSENEPESKVNQFLFYFFNFIILNGFSPWNDIRTQVQMPVQSHFNLEIMPTLIVLHVFYNQ